MKTLEELQELAVQMDYTLEELMYEMLCDSVDDMDYAIKEIARLNKIIERLVNYNELVYKRYDRKIKDYPIRSIVKHNLEIIKELKEEGKE